MDALSHTHTHTHTHEHTHTQTHTHTHTQTRTHTQTIELGHRRLQAATKVFEDSMALLRDNRSRVVEVRHVS